MINLSSINLAGTGGTGGGGGTDPAIASKVKRLNDTIGPYSSRNSLELVASENNMAISRSGAKVAKSGWAIAEFMADKGNEYLFNPGTMDGDVCVFAEKIIKQEVRSINYTYTYDADGYPVTATATYNGQTHSYTYAYEKDAEGNVIGETITDDQSGQKVNVLPYQYRTEVGTYQPLTVLNAGAELPSDGYCRFISHFQGNGQIKVVVSFNVATADKTMKVLRDGYTANLATQLGNLSQKIDESNKVMALTEQRVGDAEEEIAFRAAMSAEDDALPTLCGQPSVLFGEGTPQEAIVPDNWKQYDPETDEGYNWNGVPSALGQHYINVSASSRAEYIAVRTSYNRSDANYDVLKWLNL